MCCNLTALDNLDMSDGRQKKRWIKDDKKQKYIDTEVRLTQMVEDKVLVPWSPVALQSLVGRREHGDIGVQVGGVRPRPVRHQGQELIHNIYSDGRVIRPDSPEPKQGTKTENISHLCSQHAHLAGHSDYQLIKCKI